MHLKRRGISITEIGLDQTNQPTKGCWQAGHPALLPNIASSQLPQYAEDIERAARLHKSIIRGEGAQDTLDQLDYENRWSPRFEALGSAINPHQTQEIETLFFDAIDSQQTEGQVVAEDLWVKIAWLSFHEQDESLRFRFSFGVDHEEDVAADPIRQAYATELCSALFNESELILKNAQLMNAIQQSTQQTTLKFAECIVYFNAPNGGAYWHHDLERGHLGVVYLQVSGETLWFALPKSVLLDEIRTHIEALAEHDQWPSTLSETDRVKLCELAGQEDLLIQTLDSLNNGPLIHLMNETKGFVQQMIDAGHAYHLKPGDAILLPQQTGTIEDHQNCCWHTVFSLSDMVGEGLSFAIK